MNPIDIIGLICAILTSILYLPQLIHMIKRKSAKDVSYIFLILTILNSILWIVYGFFKNNLPIILSDVFIFVTTSIMLFIKIYYENIYIETEKN